MTAVPSAIHILDMPIHQVTMTTALETIDGFIRDGSPHHIVTADASMLVMAQEDAGLRAIISKAELITPDSEGIRWAAKRQGAPLPERVSGVEIVERLCERSVTHGYRIYFLGAAPGVADKAKARMEEKYPGTQIVGTRDGFFKDADIPAMIETIRAARPDVLVVALGIPKQEKWIAAQRATLGVPVLIGVGGTLDVLSGTVKRAPLLMRRLKLEWLWRVLSNPKKIGKVMLLPRFVAMVRARGKKIAKKIA